MPKASQKRRNKSPGDVKLRQVFEHDSWVIPRSLYQACKSILAQAVSATTEESQNDVDDFIPGEPQGLHVYIEGVPVR